MAIVTLDSALAGMQNPKGFFKNVSGTLVAGRPHSFWTMGGIPYAGTSTAGLTGEVLNSSTSGQLAFTNPTSGNTYLARFHGQASQAGTLLLCDRLWQNSGIVATTTTEQTFTNSLQIPARDGNGTVSGDGVYAGVEVLTQTSTNAPTLTLKYTNSLGTAGQTSTSLIPTVATSIVGTFYTMGLAAGDIGIQKAQSLTIGTTWTAGTLGVVLYRVLARVELTGANVPGAIDCLTSGFTRLYNNTVPFLLFIPNTTTTSNISGQVIYTQG